MADENNLTKDVQLFIVEQIARFRTGKQIIADVKEFFETILTRQQLYYYNQLCQKNLKKKPTQATKDLQNYFDACRTKFKKSIEDIGGFHQPYRLQILQEQLDEELEKVYPLKRTPTITGIIEQMAKESGGMFTNRRELTGANGAPLLPVEQMAIALFKSLKNEGFTDDEAAEFTAKRYQVDKEKIKNA